MAEHKCKYAEDKSGDVYECNGYYTKEVKCPFQYKDLNPDGSVNICECKKVESTSVTDYNFPRFERSELIDTSQTQIFK